MTTKGYVTVATGEHYYLLAQNLIRSYRLLSTPPPAKLPFAIITESDNKYTDLFDDVIIIQNASHSYLDKFLMHDNLPYDENIFIEPDMLIYQNIDLFFDVFANADDFSCIGTVSDVSDDKGWFKYSKLPEDIKPKVSFNVGLHGGILYMRKGSKVDAVFSTSKSIAANSEKFRESFNMSGFRSLPDEPIMALSMAINNCKPIKTKLPYLSCFPRDRRHFSYNIKKQRCCPKHKKENNRLLVHWGTDYTFLPKYLWEVYRLEQKYFGNKTSLIKEFVFYTKLSKYNFSMNYRNAIDHVYAKLKK